MTPSWLANLRIFSNWVARKKHTPSLVEMFAKKHPPEDIGPTLLGPKTIYKKMVTLYIPSLKRSQQVCTWKWMVGIRSFCFLLGPQFFRGFHSLLVSGRVCFCLEDIFSSRHKARMNASKGSSNNMDFIPLQPSWVGVGWISSLLTKGVAM